MYATFPRSGNSMMRRYFENITGIATGADVGIKNGLNVSLQYSVSKAEGQIGYSTWIKKSHFPFTVPFQKPEEHDMVLICSRYEVNV